MCFVPSDMSLFSVALVYGVGYAQLGAVSAFHDSCTLSAESVVAKLHCWGQSRSYDVKICLRHHGAWHVARVSACFTFRACLVPM